VVGDELDQRSLGGDAERVRCAEVREALAKPGSVVTIACGSVMPPPLPTVISWLGSPRYSGPVLIRARRLDGRRPS